MQHAKYAFKTTFAIEAPKKKVWDALLDYTMWPQWWKGLQSIRTIKDPKAPKDHKLACTVGFTLYYLNFTLLLDKIIPDKSIQILSRGDLHGIGLFTLLEKADTTTVSFTWDVETTKTWMNLLAPIARPIFIYEHNMIMDWFAKGLATHLNSKLLSITHTSS
ncbi:MAG: hypothetical protein KBD46_01905 [Candidatus Levybacteria bacterium]|nr:hypothetical protein [Candidatus Levybacteria bacterium]